MNAPHIHFLPPQREMQRAFYASDAGYDGLFYVGVRSTRIFCRPSCPAKKPKLENVEYFAGVREAASAGYRPCKRCQPLEAKGTQPAWVVKLIARVEENSEARLSRAELARLGITPERARRWFNAHYGMSFAAWCRARRLARAFTQIRAGELVDAAAIDQGYASTSGFRDAFRKTFGAPPRRAQRGEYILTHLLDSPLGQLVAGATSQGLVLLEFTDRRVLETQLATLKSRFKMPPVPGSNPHLEKLERELADYFAGKLKRFTVPVIAPGSPFQERVWRELQCIPYGETISYNELARRIGHPGASRAVGTANGWNRVCIIIPCHRVIGKDGTLRGYGGGEWRKRLLLELEKNGKRYS
jgi:AraC family transcriptional regulator of adaptative response/methylated-DNA-[protein]-cysteine methyltransferase